MQAYQNVLTNLPQSLMENKKFMSFDNSSNNKRMFTSTAYGNSFSIISMPKYSPYKECALYDTNEQLNLKHETEQVKKLKMLNKTFEENPQLKRISPIRDNFSQETYTKQLQGMNDNRFSRQQVKYMLRQAHSNILNTSDKHTKEELETITRLDMFKKEKHLAYKKPMNYINFSDAQHNIISNIDHQNDTSIRNLQCQLKSKRIIYQRPQIQEHPEYSISQLQKQQIQTEREYTMRKRPKIYQNIRQIKQLQDKFQQEKTLSTQRRFSIQNSTNDSLDKNIQYQNLQTNVLNKGITIHSVLNQRKQNESQFDQFSSKNNDKLESIKSISVISKLENKVRNEADSNAKLRLEILELWKKKQQNKKDQHQSQLLQRSESNQKI
eukprot:403341904